MTIIPAKDMQRLSNALPFWASLLMPPIAVFGALHGGPAVALMPLYSWVMFTILDRITGLNTDNPDLETPDSGLFYYRLITLIWFPVQFALLCWLIWYVPQSGLSTLEKIVMFFGMGVVSGTIGVNYAHELMHQKPSWERTLGDLLLATVLYSHFRSEHMRVHHLYVGTPRDAVTARYNEGFHRFFPRVLVACHRSAWAAELAMLARKGLKPFDKSNPYWRYWGITDILYDTQKDWAGSDDPNVVVENLKKIGRTAGMDDATLDACMKDAAMADALVKHYETNFAADKIEGTPSFIINGTLHTNGTYEDFKAVIDAELAK
jgi:alkane 1-monooxygenase